MRTTVGLCRIAMLVASGAVVTLAACSTEVTDGGLDPLEDGGQDQDASLEASTDASKPDDAGGRDAGGRSDAGVDATVDPTCGDQVRNGSETDVDCGGGCPDTCADTKGCALATDCTSGVCDATTHTCSAPTCADETKNGTETDQDCGGGCPDTCADTKGCALATDCTSRVCDATTHTCLAPTCSDETENGTETGVDCGGPCGACAALSCYAHKMANAAAADGVYPIDVDGPGGAAPFNAYCDMTTDGGGWTVMAYLRAPNQWDWALGSNNGMVGDVANGFSSGATLQATNYSFNEKLIIYNTLIENGANLGKQWMKVRRTNGIAIGYSTIVGAYAGWTYADSYGASSVTGDVCTHGCTTFRGHGMFHDQSQLGWHGTQTGDYGCRDGNNICWMSRGDGCNVGNRRCANLIGAGEGVVYAVRNKP